MSKTTKSSESAEQFYTRINAKLEILHKAAALSKKGVELLVEADAAFQRADRIEAMLNKAADLGLDQELVDPILVKSFGMGSMDLAKSIGAWRVVGLKAVSAAQRVGDESDKLIKSAQ